MVTGLTATMLVVFPESAPPSRSFASLLFPGFAESRVTKNTAEPTPAFTVVETAPPANQLSTPGWQQVPLAVTASPITPFQISSPLPDQSARNLVLQHQVIPSETARSTNQFAQNWQPSSACSPRYQLHSQPVSDRPAPAPDQPEVTGRGTRRPRPPEGPEPAVMGGGLL